MSPSPPLPSLDNSRSRAGARAAGNDDHAPAGARRRGVVAGGSRRRRGRIRPSWPAGVPTYGLCATRL